MEVITKTKPPVAAVPASKGEIATLPPSRGAANEIMETVLAKGDLSKLTPEERNKFYMAVCESVGLNPLTKPFEYILLDGKLTLYCKRDATDQLRKINQVSTEIIGRELDDESGIYTVIVRASDKSGRQDEDMGVVSLVYPPKVKSRGEWVVHPKAGKALTGLDRANAMMKATTKGKRRATLAICGLGFPDESEIEDMQPEHVPGENGSGKKTITPPADGEKRALPPTVVRKGKDDLPVQENAIGHDQPETFRKHVDLKLGEGKTQDAINEVWLRLVEPHKEGILPNDMELLVQIFREHEERVNS